ncbi:hypothetical protein GOV12_02270 [Candidatus Pacearchaeota archaeon]|nr:hypothetical protein [Candidatus Pacearchaeota archaeon]
MTKYKALTDNERKKALTESIKSMKADNFNPKLMKIYEQQLAQLIKGDEDIKK